ncbi:PTS sugar transporter subunit IIA [Geosporobacter ferrireducens]|uniref:PTS EIIA type-4 domain-containing protein n=1 Tax=Geosporobacter ferrireducens TaxID=1424294 RepID=A0A1D8GKL5_9FIRM|nr:hypothetical protein [Geosporobacter ferrireducens]AOT71448.1 hypothetical protein Gferi_19090 [Geosporobacter ferrireducens]MTI57754.1 hypothetical protein [Geosporobacter ferrireducens]
MRNTILLSHGTLAEGVYKAASMIYGDLENVYYLCLEEKMGIEAFKEKLKELIKGLDHSNEIIVLTDISGGSPYTAAVNVFLSMGMIHNFKMIAGLNLTLLLSTLFRNEELSEDGLDEIIDEARQGISKFQLEDDGEDNL